MKSAEFYERAIVLMKDKLKRQNYQLDRLTDKMKLAESKTPKTKDGVFMEMPEEKGVYEVWYFDDHSCMPRQRKVWSENWGKEMLSLGKLYTSRKICDTNEVLIPTFWHDMLKQDGASLNQDFENYNGMLCFDCKDSELKMHWAKHSVEARCYFKGVHYDIINYAHNKYTKDELKLIFMGGE